MQEIFWIGTGKGEKRKEKMSESRLNLKSALQRLKLDDTKVLNVYVMGSRLWGTAKASSDWDLLIVHEDNGCAARRSLHHGDIDAIALHRDEFAAQVRDHHFLELAAAAWAPRELVWRERFDLRRSAAAAFDPRALAAAVAEESTRDWAMARKFAEKGDAHRAVGVLAHTLRMAVIARGIARSGKVEAWDAGNQVARIARDLEPEVVAGGGWATLEREVGPLRERLLEELRAEADSKKK